MNDTKTLSSLPNPNLLVMPFSMRSKLVIFFGLRMGRLMLRLLSLGGDSCNDIW